MFDDEKRMKKLIIESVGQALEDIVLPRFEQIDVRFDKIEDRLSHLEYNVRLIYEKINDIEERLSRLEENYRADSEVLYNDLEKHKKAIFNIEKRLKVLEARH